MQNKTYKSLDGCDFFTMATVPGGALLRLLCGYLQVNAVMSSALAE
jgi:hypothetical protein